MRTEIKKDHIKTFHCNVLFTTVEELIELRNPKIELTPWDFEKITEDIANRFKEHGFTVISTPCCPHVQFEISGWA